MLEVAKEQACICSIIHTVFRQHSNPKKQSKEVQDPEKEGENIRHKIGFFKKKNLLSSLKGNFIF